MVHFGSKCGRYFRNHSRNVSSPLPCVFPLERDLEPMKSENALRDHLRT